MARTAASFAFLRFAAGTAGSVLFGLAVFSVAVFRPAHPPFQCVSVGALFAGILALVRARRPGAAVGFALGFAALLVVLASPRGAAAAWSAGLASVALGAGALVVAVVFDALADAGHRFGKFLAAGPLLAGVYLAVTPLSGLGAASADDVHRSLWLNALLGLLIGDGAGLGVELAELHPRLRKPGHS